MRIRYAYKYLILWNCVSYWISFSCSFRYRFLFINVVIYESSSILPNFLHQTKFQQTYNVAKEYIVLNISNDESNQLKLHIQFNNFFLIVYDW